MNLALLLPSALLALSALLIPLLIHLSRRSEQKPTDFAALRWISAQLRPRRKLVFQEILLLLLRLLLLIALALFLAKPVSMQSRSAEHWVVVVPGADIAATKNLSLDASAEQHWLTPGFPNLDEMPKHADVPLASLLRELDARLPANAALTVVVPEQIAGLDGERIRLSRKVDWKITAGTQAHDGDRRTNNDRTPGLRLAIRLDEKHIDEAVYFRAANSAWQAEAKAGQKETPDIADIATPLKNHPSTLVWLSAGQLPAEIQDWIKRGGTAVVSNDARVPEMKSGVVAWRNENGKALALAAALGQGRVLQWQQALMPDAMPELLDADFPEKLQSLLQAKPAAPTRAFADTQMPQAGAKAGPELPQSLQIWLALLIAGLFLLERWLANAAQRWSAA